MIIKNQVTTLLFVLHFFAIPLAIHADEIFLKGGQKDTTEIVDTSGCLVQATKNGDTLSIKKNSITKIIWKSDTVYYEDYICADRPKILRMKDTPDYKIMTLLDNSQVLARIFKENAKLVYLQYPLQGNYNLEEFVGIQQSIIDLFKQKATFTALNSDELIAELTKTNNSIYDYALLTRQYHVVENRLQNKGFLGAGPNLIGHNKCFSGIGTNSNRQKKNELYTTCTIVLYNIQKNEIVLRKIITEKRSLWGESDYSWTGMLTPVHIKNEWEKQNSDRTLDKNAQSIRKKLVQEFNTYLGLE